MPFIQYEDDFIIWNDVKVWYEKAKKTYDLTAISLIEENLRFSLKLAYTSLVWIESKSFFNLIFIFLNFLTGAESIQDLQK